MIAHVLISVPARGSLREQTLAGLDRLGIVPQVFLGPDRGGGRHSLAGIAENGRRALSSADRAAEYICLYEDDLLFGSRFPQVLGESTAAGVPAFTPFLSGHKQFRPRHLPSGLFPIVNQRRWYGGQCLLMRRDVVAAMLDDWDEYMCPDMRLRHVCGEHGWRIWACRPSVVQHAGERSIWRRGRRQLSGDFEP